MISDGHLSARKDRLILTKRSPLPQRRAVLGRGASGQSACLRRVAPYFGNRATERALIRKHIATLAALLASCTLAAAQSPFGLEPIATLYQPWAMASLPQGGFLVTEKAGRLVHVSTSGEVQVIAGAPGVTDSGQVGLHDVALSPDFEASGVVYLTWVDGTNGGALHLGRGRLNLAGCNWPIFKLFGGLRPWAARGIRGRWSHLALTGICF